MKKNLNTLTLCWPNTQVIINGSYVLISRVSISQCEVMILTISVYLKNDDEKR